MKQSHSNWSVCVRCGDVLKGSKHFKVCRRCRDFLKNVNPLQLDLFDNEIHRT